MTAREIADRWLWRACRLQPHSQYVPGCFSSTYQRLKHEGASQRRRRQYGAVARLVGLDSAAPVGLVTDLVEQQVFAKH